ncbi:ADP-ribosylglycohydrolase family protein [Alloiococcus sp. CFN-8]|uniref:ADP-ribosylglycohydrolase family protein n=1 Tax=Alloiococcus sp. CFN-8 TaxID=3416081 RepID=UPI003CF6064F
MDESILYKFKGAILGHAVGDALGVPVEFYNREELDRSPVTEMEGFGTYPYPAGTWSDDTSMTLAALDSLSEGLHYDDIMVKFCQWLYNDEYTPSGETFDNGITTEIALDRYRTGNKPPLECGETGERSNGNGSLMRIIPFILYTKYSSYSMVPLSGKMNIIHNASSLTHGHPRSKIACGIYAYIMDALLDNPRKESVYSGLEKAMDYYKNQEELSKYTRLFQKNFQELSRDEIKSSGYVVDTLEASIWCLLTTDSYKDCVLKAVNLGEDTDTVAAIAGGLAGILYGYDSIPEEWLSVLARKDYIISLCEKAYASWE